MKTTITRATAALMAIGALFAAMLLLAGGSSAAPSGGSTCSYPACPISSGSSSNSSGGVHVSGQTRAGGTIVVHGEGCAPGGAVKVFFDGTLIGSGTANAAGRYNIKATIPSNASPGSHTITVSGPGANCSGVEGISVTAPGGGGNSDSGGLAGTGVAVVGIGALGAVLLIGGGMMLLAGKRRNSKHA